MGLILTSVTATLLPALLRKRGLTVGQYGVGGEKGEQTAVGGCYGRIGAVVCRRSLSGMTAGDGWLLLLRLRFLSAAAEIFVEDIRGEVFAQTGAVQDCPAMVVDEGDAIDAVVFVATQYEVDALRGEFPAESGLCPGALHGGGNDAAGTFFELLVPDCGGGLLHLFFDGGNAGGLAEDGGFDRCAGLFAVLVQCGVHDAVVRAAAGFAFDFVHTYVVQGKQGSELAHGLEAVHLQEGFHYIGDLFFQVAFAAVHGGELPVVALLPPFCRMQTVLLFQFFGDRLAAAVLVAVVDLPAGTVHPEANDMDVPALDVLVLENQIGLVAISQFTHVFLADGRELFVGEHVVGVRIEGDVDNGLLRPVVGRHPPPEVVHAVADAELPVFGLQDEIGGKHTGMTFVHLVLVVGKGTVKGLSRTYFRNHRLSKVLDSSTILRLNSISSSVDFSNR